VLFSFAVFLRASHTVFQRIRAATHVMVAGHRPEPVGACGGAAAEAALVGKDEAAVVLANVAVCAERYNTQHNNTETAEKWGTGGMTCIAAHEPVADLLLM
jgi:hypothetical protein